MEAVQLYPGVPPLAVFCDTRGAGTPLVVNTVTNTAYYAKNDVPTAIGSATAPGGSNTQVQFNNAGAFGGDADFIFDLTNNILTLGSVAAPGYIGSPSGTAGSAGAALTVFTGAGDGAGAGGAFLLSASEGGATGVGGAVTILAGSGGATSGAGGNAALQGGSATNGNSAGGAVTLGGGPGTGTGNGGDVTFEPGAGGASGALGNVVCTHPGGGALATTTTGGFLCVPTCAGAPSGTPASIVSGTVPLIYDTTNNRLYVRNGGAWKLAAFV